MNGEENWTWKLSLVCRSAVEGNMGRINGRSVRLVSQWVQKGLPRCSGLTINCSVIMIGSKDDCRVNIGQDAWLPFVGMLSGLLLLCGRVAGASVCILSEGCPFSRTNV